MLGEIRQTRRIGDSSVRPAKPGTFEEFMHRVLESTCELFYLLEAAEHIQAQFETGARTQDFDTSFGPSRLSVQLSSVPKAGSFTLAGEFGCDGRMAQLAYVGWMAAVDGAWEKFRTTKQPPGPAVDMPLGLEADLLGDFHKIRNDLLKNRGVAQDRNCGRCKTLRWFQPGERIHLTLDHVFEFLHLLGLHLNNYMGDPSDTPAVFWKITCDAPATDQPFRVLSRLVTIEKNQGDRAEGYAIVLSMMFADGLTWGVEAATAPARNELTETAEALRQAPLDAWGAPIHPDEGPLDVPRTYRHARETILSGERPFVPSGVWMRFRR